MSDPTAGTPYVAPDPPNLAAPEPTPDEVAMAGVDPKVILTTPDQYSQEAVNAAERATIRQTDNGPRPEDGEQPAEVAE